ncbi:putative tryptophan--tRNA ligase [Leptospira borgpetersenii str. 200701203]|uniref:tryptophan--tRNA ligase n=6 Tax=Leptospira borgpetersenii TaxID=174 RepID=M3FCY5_LEPBO|nr:putative tryptophan--tRNA ligase [Leptospira borgpetersenii str. 200701203]
MAADILGFDSDQVPVGKDQKQHLEFARDIASNFNREIGPVFKVPEPEIDETTALVPGTDGQKMSKSYGNTINFFDSEKELKKSIMSITTDSAGIDEVKDPSKSNIYAIHSLFLDEKGREALKQKFLIPGTGYGELKKQLLQDTLDYFAPFRQEREKIGKDKSFVEAALKKGQEKARNTITNVLDRTRKELGIYQF